MFTGIVQAFVPVSKLDKQNNLLDLSLQFPSHLLPGLALGASVAVEGCCLTVVAIDGDLIRFQLIEETLNRTCLSKLKLGDFVNVERSARFGDEIGGHIVSGHVHTTAKIIAIKQPENNKIVTFAIDKPWLKYILPKGFIALAGTSLTLVDVDKEKNTFSVHLIPETLARSTWGLKKLNDIVNVECEQATITIVDTVERVLANYR